MARPKDPHARAALLAAARREFVTHGIVRARIEDLTQACGLSKGAFYLHFESKEALFRELVEALQAQVETLRVDRQRAYQALAERRAQGGGPGLLTELLALDAREDRRLLEVLWEWRDVTDVLLRGCQGTEFEGVVWQVLDHEGARVREQCLELQRAGLVRAGVNPDLLVAMVLGTYLMVARRFAQARERPDFEPLVQGLQQVLAHGTQPPAPPTPAARKARAVRRRPTVKRSTSP